MKSREGIQNCDNSGAQFASMAAMNTRGGARCAIDVSYAASSAEWDRRSERRRRMSEYSTASASMKINVRTRRRRKDRTIYIILPTG